MPTNRELVPNRPLAGTELAEIIRKDLDQMLRGDGLLSGHIAYGRVAYDLTLRLHMDNPAFPESVSKTASIKRTATELESAPHEAAIETPPLAKPLTAEALPLAHRIVRRIVSPNATRIEHGLPVTVQRRQLDGSVVDEQIHYDRGLVPADVENVQDESDAAQAEVEAAWGEPERRSQPEDEGQ